MQNATPSSNQSNTAAPDPLVRAKVREMLMQSEGFRALPADTQKDVAKHTASIANYLAVPEGIPGNKIPGGIGAPAQSLAEEATFQDRQAAVDAIGNKPFEAEAAREGARVAGELLEEVQFPAFVSGLIEGVFHSIVSSSLEQMEAYAAMIASVAQSLDQFMKDNVSENQGRDHTVDFKRVVA